MGIIITRSGLPFDEIIKPNTLQATGHVEVCPILVRVHYVSPQSAEAEPGISDSHHTGIASQTPVGLTGDRPRKGETVREGRTNRWTEGRKEAGNES